MYYDCNILLLHLPLEIIVIICNNLNTKDKIRLLLCNKEYGELIKPFLKFTEYSDILYKHLNILSNVHTLNLTGCDK